MSGHEQARLLERLADEVAAIDLAGALWRLAWIVTASRTSGPPTEQEVLRTLGGAIQGQLRSTGRQLSESQIEAWREALERGAREGGEG